MEVDRIGPLRQWDKPEGWNSPIMVISTNLEGKKINYQFDSIKNFSDIYQEAIGKSKYVPNFFDNQSKSNKPKKPKLLGPKSKRKFISNDSEDDDFKSKDDEYSSDEDYSPRSKKSFRKRLNQSKIKNNDVKMGKIPQILKTFDKDPGFGAPLADLLPTELVQSKDAVAAFLMFVLERQKTWSNKRKGRKILTSNQTIATNWFTNMYR